MRRCSACRIERYCVRRPSSHIPRVRAHCDRLRQSKSCQKRAWPVHKKICKLNQDARGLHGDACFDALRAFTRKHRATITAATIMAVQEYYDPPPTVPREDVISIDLRTRPASACSRPETFFYVVGVRLDTLGAFCQGQGQGVEVTRLRLRATREEAQKHIDRPCAAMVALLRVIDPGQELTNVVPFVISPDPGSPLDLGTHETWRDYLFYMMNKVSCNEMVTRAVISADYPSR